MTERATVRGRVVAVIAMSVLVAGGLSACRTDAGSAAYIGNTRVTDSQIRAIAASLPAQPASSALATDTGRRNAAVVYLTFTDVASRLAKEKGYGAPTVSQSDYANYAASFNVDPSKAASNAFIQTVAEAGAWRQFLLSKTPASQPTLTDLHELYDDATIAGATQGATFDQLQSALMGVTGLGAAGVLKSELEDAAKRYGVSVNPLYLSDCSVAPCSNIEVPLLEIQAGQSQFESMFVSLATDASPAVLDQPTAAPGLAAPAG